VLTNNFAQPAPNAIPHNRAPERARRDKSGAKTSGVTRLGNTKHDELAAISSAVLFYLLEFRGLSEAATLRKCELSHQDTVYVIPTEVEESLTISVLDPFVSSETFRDVSTSLDMTKDRYSKSLSPAGAGERLRNNVMSLTTEKAMC
jgi:hypothetical protein